MAKYQDIQITKYFLDINSNAYFIFGDNLERRGYGGAAVLRDHPHAFGFITKKFPDKNLEDKLYGDYKKSYEDLKRKEKGFDTISKDVDKEEEIGKDSIEGLSLSSLIKMGIPSFRSEIKNYSPSQLKSLKKSLIDRKNLSLNELRTLRRSKSKDLDKAKSKEDKTLTLNKYNSRIYEVGEFIDKIREKISHLNA